MDMFLKADAKKKKKKKAGRGILAPNFKAVVDNKTAKFTSC